MITTDNSQTLINALAEIDRLGTNCRALDAKVFKTVLECRTLLDAAEAECDALRKDAKRWQVIKTLFRVMSPNIDGSHTWVQSHYGTLRGGNMNQAVDNLIKQVGEK